MMLSPRPLVLAIQLVLATGATHALAADVGADAGADDSRRTLPVVEVSALPLGEDASQVAAPYSLVEGEEVLVRGAATLGEALDHLPGVRADTFGAGSSRPVIRGQTAPRVAVLSDGAAVIDASQVSPDHAVTVDPLLTRRIEVLRGPATLLYGSGAVGGVVNVLDRRVPDAIPERGTEGAVALRGNTVANERAGAAEFTTALGSRFALHAEASYRDADEYKAPRPGHDDHDDHGHDDHGHQGGRVEGTFAESRNASIGMSWIGDRGYTGLAYSYREDEYGIPGHSDEYGACHPHGSALHCGSHDDHDHDHGHGDEHESPLIDLRSSRVDLRGEYYDPFAGFERVRFRATHTDYRHNEIEDDEIETTFRNKGFDSRVELQHVPLGAFTGVLGLQHSDTRFSATGSEAFLPEVDTRSTGLFLVEHLQLGEQWHLEFGARHERVTHEPVNDPRNRPRFSDNATSLSAAAVWQLDGAHTLTLSAARSERLPGVQELYARGVHLATSTFECGLMPHPLTCGGAANNQPIETETSHNIELGVRRTEGPLTYAFSWYRNAVDDYIYARTLDRFEDFRLIKYSQADATFRGFEAELGWRFNDIWSATVFGDRVRASLEDGDPLPRIPADRIGARLDARWGDLGGELEVYRTSTQNRVGDLDEPVPGHEMVNLTVTWSLGNDRRTTLFLRGSNLLDEVVYNPSSYLATVVPLHGRNFSAGLRWTF
jgi:iron complex outermembrane recepter protein